jgi:hypothetical protein
VPYMTQRSARLVACSELWIKAHGSQRISSGGFVGCLFSRALAGSPLPRNPGRRKNTVSGEGFRWPPVPPMRKAMRKAMCSTQRTIETEAQIIKESAERTSGAEV